MFQRTKICSGLLLAFGSGMLAVAPGAFAQDTTVQRVEITGSSIKRVDAETALPVQVVTREAIDKLGVTNTEQLFATISANSQVGANTTAQGAGASTYGESAISLRGLGQNRTLVLVNGRRLANYATDGTAVDINSIPLAIIERVEILKDGASGVYGSDAVAGVVNFITRKNFKGVEVSAYAGTPTEKGGGQSTKGSILFGFGDMDKDHYTAMASLDIAKESAIYGRTRSYANRAWDNGGLFDVSATPSGNLIVGTTGSSPGIGNPLSPDNCAANGSGYDANLGTCRFNSSPFVPLLPDVNRVNAAATLRARVNDNNDFFIEGFLSNNKTVTTEQYSPYNNSFLSTDFAFATKGITPAIVMNPTNPAYQSVVLPYLQAYDAAHGTTLAGGPISVSYRAVDGGPRVHTDNSTLLHLATGFEGSLFGLDYDAVYSHNTSTVKETTQSGYQTQTALVQLLSGNDAFNPFVEHQSAALAKQIAATNYVGPMISSTLSTDAIDAKVSRSLATLPGGDLTGAFGVSFRKEQLDLSPSAAYMSGDVSGYGGQVLPLNATRNSHSVFAEIDAPIFKSLEADLSVRNDHYPNASTTNPKVSLSYTPLSEVKLRGSYGKGFREASLPELYNPQTVGTTATFKDPKCLADPRYAANPTVCNGQWNQTLGGNPDLAPEKSKQYSFGLVLEPIKNMSATVDYYHIKVNNLVTTLGAQFLVDQESDGVPGYAGLVTRDPTTGLITNIENVNLNAGSVETAGIDFDLNWKSSKSSLGQFGVNFNGTWMLKYDETLPDGTVQPSVGATLTPDGTPLAAVEAGGILFRWKHSLTGSWEYGNFGLQLTQNFQSKYLDSSRADCSTDIECATPVKQKSFQTWDLQGAFSGFQNLTLRLGVKNVFDRKPPAAVTLGQYFQVGYDPTYYDPHGRFVYASGTYRF